MVGKGHPSSTSPLYYLQVIGRRPILNSEPIFLCIISIWGDFIFLRAEAATAFSTS